MEKKFLIYYTTIGSLYCNLTNISIYTLLNKGEYKDDILVFGDEYFEHNNIHNVKFIKINRGEHHPIFTRIFSSHCIALNDYSQIMYLDSDIEILKNIYPLFKAENKILCTKETHHTFSSFGYGHPCTSAFLTEKEYEENKDMKIVNSGTYCVDTNLFPAFMTLWKSIILSRPTEWGTDQSSLNYMILKDLIKCDFFEPGLISFPNLSDTSEEQLKIGDEILLHYISDELKTKMLEKYYNTLFS